MFIQYIVKKLHLKLSVLPMIYLGWHLNLCVIPSKKRVQKCDIYQTWLYLWLCNYLIYVVSDSNGEKNPAEIKREKEKKRYAAMSASDKQEKIEKVIVTRTSNRVREEEAYREMFKNSCSQAVLASVPKRPITRSVTRGGYIYIVTVLYIYICPGLVKPFSMEHALCEHVYTVKNHLLTLEFGNQKMRC